jgi:acylphosphatase
LPDGRVEAVFEGPRDAVHQAVRWCHSGSPSSYVERVDVRYEPATSEFRDFRVRW